MGIIQRWKDRGLTPEQVPPARRATSPAASARALYAAYQARLRALNAADFGDLLLHMTEILRTHPDVLAQYHRTFRYILVDEYQDTNVVQYLWLRLLAQAHRTSAAWATTTSRSTPGAAPRWRTSCASSRISPAPRSCGWSATTAPPRRSWRRPPG